MQNLSLMNTAQYNVFGVKFIRTWHYNYALAPEVIPISFEYDSESNGLQLELNLRWIIYFHLFQIKAAWNEIHP